RLQLRDQVRQEDDHGDAADHPGQDQHGLHAAFAQITQRDQPLERQPELHRRRAATAGDRRCGTQGARGIGYSDIIGTARALAVARTARCLTRSPGSAADDGTITTSPSASPPVTSTTPTPRSPTATGTCSARPPRTTSTDGPPSDDAPPSASRTASAATTSAASRRPTTISTETVISGLRNAGGCGTRRRTSTVPRCASTDGAM